VLRPVLLRRDPEIERSAAALGVDLGELELSGGDDYALVATVRDPGPFTVIGAIEAGEGVVVERDGRREPAPLGYRHR